MNSHNARMSLLGLIVILCICGCTKKSSSNNGPSSTFSITFNGKTISVPSSSSNATPLVAITQTDAGGLSGALPYSQVFDAIITVNDPKIAGTIDAYKTDLSSAIGTYKIANVAYIDNTSITDYTDGGKVYNNVQDTTASSITISVSNNSEVKGTFSLMLTYNGANYPATGSFDYKH